IAVEDCYSGTDFPLLQYNWAPLRSLTTAGWKYIRSPEAELYDMSTDPQETDNLAAVRPEQVRALEDQLVALEQSRVVHQGRSVRLTPQERQALESLGYLGGDSGKASPTGGAALPDVKRMLPYQKSLAAARKKLLDGQPAEAEQESRR